MTDYLKQRDIVSNWDTQIHYDFDGIDDIIRDQNIPEPLHKIIRESSGDEMKYLIADAVRNIVASACLSDAYELHCTTNINRLFYFFRGVLNGSIGHDSISRDDLESAFNDVPNDYNALEQLQDFQTQVYIAVVDLILEAAWNDLN